jgi:LacI family transcriptional regulator
MSPLSRQIEHRIAVRLNLDRGPAREAARGVIRFARLQANWELILDDWTYRPNEKHDPGLGEQDAIIVIDPRPEVLEKIRCAGIPVVVAFGPDDAGGVPQVTISDEQVAQTAFEYLRSLHYSNFAAIGVEYIHHVSRRIDHFIALAAEVGCPCPARILDRADWNRRMVDAEWELASWIDSLPKPLGLVVGAPFLGEVVLGACRQAGVLVPEEVALLTCGESSLWNEATCPSLTSVDEGSEFVGFQAARCMLHLLRGEPIEPLVRHISPAGVTSRQSTDVVAIGDSGIARALRRVRQRALSGESLEQISEDLGLPAEQLDTGFRQWLGRSPSEELNRVRIEYAKELLGGTEMPLEKITAKAGYSSRTQFVENFRKLTGMLPGEYRKQNSAFWGEHTA